MKQFILIMILGASLSTYAQKEKTSSFSLSTHKYSAFKDVLNPDIMRSPSQLPSQYFRDANGKIIDEDNINSIPVDKSGIFYKINERAKRFPEHLINENHYRNK
jgi:hypothetical protein